MARPPLSEHQQCRAERVIRPWLAMLLRTAEHLTRHAQQAEDLVQEAVLKAMQAIDTYRDGTDAKAWLMTILRRTQIDRVRASQRRPMPLPLEADQDLEPAANTDHDAGKSGEQWNDPGAMLEAFSDELLIQALRALPEPDAARVLEVPEGTIKSRAHRGRKLLRDHLHTLAPERGWVSSHK